MLATFVVASGCSDASGPTVVPAEVLDAVLAPTAATKNLRGEGGAHFHGRGLMRVRPLEPTPTGLGERDSIETTTDLWMDKSGHYRLLEVNDRDGGREIVLHGKTLGVALRYGKMIARPAQEPEPTRFVEEALGGPFAAWEVARRYARVERREEKGPDGPIFAYALTRDASVEPPAEPPRPAEGAAASPDTPSLAAWRGTTAVQSLTGQIRVQAATGALVSAHLEVRFTLDRGGFRCEGWLKADAEVTDRGRVAPVAPPDASVLPPRPRTILEERALLGRSTPAQERRRR